MLNTTELIEGSNVTSTFECATFSPVPLAIPTSVMVVGILQGIITFVGLLGNALVVFVLIMARDRQDTSSVIYVLNLAVADFLFLATVPFKIAQNMTLVWKSGEFMCKFAGGFVTYLNFLVSPLFLMVMSVDRYLAVNKAVSSAKLRAVKSSRYVSVGVWLVAVCAVLPLAFLHTTYPEQLQCKPKFPGYEESPIAHNDYCQSERLYHECTQNYVMNYTLSTRAALLLDDAPPENRYERMKRKTETTTKASKKRKNSKKRRKTKKRKNKNQKLKNLDNNLQASTIPVKFSQSKTYSEPSPINVEMTTSAPLDDITELKRGFLIANNEASTPLLRSETNTSTDIHSLSDLTTIYDGFLDAADICWDLIYPSNEEALKCTHYEPYSFKVWIILNFFYSYLIPCCAIVICYMAILRKLYQPSGIAQETRGRIRRKAMRQKVTWMVTMLVISYMVCFTPYYIWQLGKVPGVPVSSIKICHHMQRFNATMAYVNSALNPLLYTFLSEQFGSKFRLAWRRVTRKTAYHIGTIRAAREKNSGGLKHSDKRETPILPRDKNSVNHSRNRNGSTKVEEEDQRHLMEEVSNISRSNGNIRIVVADIVNPIEITALQKYETNPNTSSSADDVPRNSCSHGMSLARLEKEPMDVDKKDKSIDIGSGVISTKPNKNRRSMLLRILDCTSSDEPSCPECAQIGDRCNDDAIRIDATKESDDDLTLTIEMTSLNKEESIQSRRRIRSDNDYDNTKLCRKHKKCLRRHSKFKNDFQSMKNDPGGWRPMSSFDDSKFLTEATVL